MYIIDKFGLIVCTCIIHIKRENPKGAGSGRGVSRGEGGAMVLHILNKSVYLLLEKFALGSVPPPPITLVSLLV